MALGQCERNVASVTVAEEQGSPALEEIEEVGDVVFHPGRRRLDVPRFRIAPAVVDEHVARRGEAGAQPGEAGVAVHGTVDAGDEGGTWPAFGRRPF